MKPVLQLSFLLLVSIALSACAFAESPGSTSLSSPSPDRVTEELSLSTQDLTPVPVKTTQPALQQPSYTPSSAQPAGETPFPSVTPIPFTSTPECNQASPGNPIDLSIPDDTILHPGEAFTKTWRLKNAGACSWTKEYTVVWFSGERFGAPQLVNLPNEVAPGHSIDLSLDMVAPEKPGIYQSNWKLQDTAGFLFGIGPGSGSPFWVRIEVIPLETSQPSATNEVTPTVEVYAGGLVNLHAGEQIDLDTLQINRGEGDDLLFNQPDPSTHRLEPIQNARLAVFGTNEPFMTECQAAALSADPVAIDSLALGTYLCYRTNQGLPGMARPVYLNGEDGVLSIEFTTWFTP